MTETDGEPAAAGDPAPRRDRPRLGPARWWARWGMVPIAALVIAGLSMAGLRSADGPGTKGTDVDQLVAPEAVVLSRLGVSESGPPPPPEVRLAPNYEQVLGMTVSGETMVAVGERAARPRDSRPDLAEPLIWWSTDGGAQWNPVSLPMRGRLTAVGAAGGRFIAVGYLTESTGTTALVLVSEDGRSWVEESVPGEDVLLDTVVATPSGAVLAGGRADLAGRVPVALVQQEAGEWRQVVLLGDADGREAEIRGSCARGDDVTLVGMVTRDGGEKEPLVLRSSDGGHSWGRVALPGSVLVGTQPRANGCAVAGDRVVVAGTAEVRGYDRAFVSVEDNGTWREAHLLEPSNLQRNGHTIGFGAVSSGPDLVVFGYDSSNDEPGSDLAVWRQVGDGAWGRLDALEALGAGTGVGVGFTAVSRRGVLVVGGSSSDRAVIWRSSPDLAVTPAETTVTTTEIWWATHRDTDVCELVDQKVLDVVFDSEGVVPRLLPQPVGPVIDCSWARADGTPLLSVAITPARRLEAFAASYPSSLPRPYPLEDICQEATFYPGFLTATARCGDTLVAVSGLPAEEGGILLKSVARRFAD